MASKKTDVNPKKQPESSYFAGFTLKKIDSIVSANENMPDRNPDTKPTEPRGFADSILHLLPKHHSSCDFSALGGNGSGNVQVLFPINEAHIILYKYANGLDRSSRLFHFANVSILGYKSRARPSQISIIARINWL